MRTWKQVKLARIILVGKRCELCHKKLEEKEIVGHHVLGKEFSKKNDLYLVELCQLRCEDCECRMHQRYPGGNPPQLVQEVKSFGLYFMGV
jgi:hypothetical protein